MTAQLYLLLLSLSASPRSSKQACSVAQGQSSDLPARASSSLLGGVLFEFSIPTD